MRATRRRQRKADSLASLQAVRSIIDRLRSGLPGVIPQRDKELVRLLRAARHTQRYPATYAVRHAERRPATDTLRCCPSHWPREKLTEAASVLRGLLKRETSSRVSVNSFIGQYIPVLNFPADVAGTLSKGEINLREATHSHV